MRGRERSRLTVRAVCFAVVLVAAVVRLCDTAVVRLCGAATWDGVRQTTWDGVRQAAVFLSLGISALPEADEPSSEGSVPSHAEYEALEYRTAPPAAVFSAEDATLVQIDNRAGAEFDAAALITQPLSLKCETDEPLVLIIHTHATEAYTMTAETQYHETSAYRTDDTAHNVVRVGQALTDRLNDLGIATLHDTQLHDLDGYNDAYDRSGASVVDYLTRYPSIQIVIDVHRDAADDGAGGQLALTTQTDSGECAQLMLVMGTEMGGYPHPNWRESLSLAMKLQAQGEKATSGLFRPLSLRASRFNEHLAPYGLLLEVGTAGNTLPQAERSAERFAEALAQVLCGE